MTTDRQLDKILDETLDEIRRDHRKISAPERLESSLGAAASLNKHAGSAPTSRFAPSLRFSLTAATALIALGAVLFAAFVWQARKSPQPQIQQVRSVPPSGVVPESVVPPPQGAKSPHTRKTGTGRAPHRDSSPAQAAWTVDEFVPLPASEGLPPAVELSVVRLKVRGSDLQQYGLQAPADAVAQTMMAEFVVGEDGLPRAIRIVR